MGSQATPSLYDWAADYLKVKYDKPGNVYVGIVSRLDALTTGVVVLARTSKAAARLSQQFRDATPEKTYLAVVDGKVPEKNFRWVDWLIKDDAAHRMRAVNRDTRDSKQAILRGTVVTRTASRTVLRIQLETGRKHQIRVQAADRGHPICGDRKYGSTQPFQPGIALHALRLTIQHPTRKEPLSCSAAPPRSWKSLGIAPEFLTGE